MGCSASSREVPHHRSSDRKQTPHIKAGIVVDPDGQEHELQNCTQKLRTSERKHTPHPSTLMVLQHADDEELGTEAEKPANRISIRSADRKGTPHPKALLAMSAAGFFSDQSTCDGQASAERSASSFFDGQASADRAESIETLHTLSL
eukprot:TRINITY_DN21256_c0_g1_i1.p1 TRINITY_DN21256_c0_g1~~TRINITY_DN21256_c0_g1_i1.p1  ORF type:complete len:148 (+),score=20.57 TRINITY_DN21256_c0_g1_i1:86-529(+)